MLDDAELLRRYAARRDEDAFAELVRRHLAFVYAAALRQVSGDASLAQDVAQSVFADLARKAAALAQHRVLAGWLFTSTRYAAAKAVRGEQRRRIREAEAHLMHELDHDPMANTDWTELRPVIDEVLASLAESDRQAVLLRFFEGRPFPEIGARLAISGDAARLRIERALEKMRGGLARHGVKSTSAALALALANQPAVALPAELATTVTDAALALATTTGGLGGVALGGGGGLAASFGKLAFMSTAKFSGTTIGALVLLAASIAGNIFLLSESASHESALTTAHDSSPAAANTIATSDAARKSATPAGKSSAALQTSAPSAIPPALVKQADLAALRDRMKASGASEADVRAALEGILLRRYREQLSADRAARLQRGWWRDRTRTWGTAEDMQLPVGDPRLMHDMVTVPLDELLGTDPLVAAADAARYSFLPAALQAEFGRLDRAAISGWAHTGDKAVDAQIEARVDQSRRDVEEQRAALLASLTPEQRADYEMRLGAFSRGLAAQLQAVAVTEAEFRAVFPVADAYAKALATAQGSVASPDAQRQLEQNVVDQLVAALGFDRALDYVWSGSNEYAAYARAARERNLPADVAGKAVQLAAETGARAAAIHANEALSLAEKQSALDELQRTVRPGFDALIPPETQQRLNPLSLAWLNQLGEGRYTVVAGPLPGRIRTLMPSGSTSIAAPPNAASSRLVLPQRPAGR